MKQADILLDGFEPQNKSGNQLKRYLLRYLSYWYLYLIGIVVSISLAFLYTKYAVPQYMASTTILINDVARGGDFNQNAIYSDLEGYQTVKTVENEAEILGSATLMNLVFKELDFRISVFKQDNFLRKLEIFGNDIPVDIQLHEYDSSSFFSEELQSNFEFVQINESSFRLEDKDGESAHFNFGDTIRKAFGSFTIISREYLDPTESLTIQFVNPYRLPYIYGNRLDVFPLNRQGSVIRVSLLDPVPRKAVLVLDRLIEVYNREAVRNKNLTAVTTLEFIEEQLVGVMAELRQIEVKEEQYKRENQITELSSNALQYSQNADNFRNQLSDFNIRLEVLESIERYIQNHEDGFHAVPSTMDIQDPTLSSLVVEYNELQSERERMLRTAQPGSPLVQNLNDQITTVRQSLLGNLSNIKGSVQIARNNLMNRLNQLDVLSNRVPEIERQLVEITREKITKQDHYNYLLEKREEAAMSLAATTVANSRVIDRASAGSKPSKPNKPLIFVFAFFMGVAVPFGYVLAKFQLTDKILSKDDILSNTSRGILGEVFHSQSQESNVIGKGKKTALAEQFRLIRTNIQFALPKHDRKVMMVTSGLPGEGKSFITLNLAISFALTGKKVAVCEFDLRKPGLFNRVGLSRGNGITDFILKDELGIDQITVTLPSICEGLDFFSCGSIPEDPAEIMMDPKVGQLIEALKEGYDVVLLDTAPVGQVADAYALSEYVDLTVFVMRYEYTPVKMTERLNDDYKDKKLKNPMIVLNDAKDVYDSIYKYGYKYGYYAESDRPKTSLLRRIVNQKSL